VSTVLAAGNAINQPKRMTINDKIANRISVMKSQVEIDKQPNGKYKRQAERMINGVKYRVDEYETSKGEIGYTITITKEQGNKIYRRAVSTGVEKASREFDWRLIKDNTIVATATTTTATTTQQ